MKKIIRRTLLFILSVVISLLILDLMATLFFRHDIIRPGLEEKVIALIRDGQDIIVAGDSRAERQVIPSIIHDSTNMKVINIAAVGGDLVTTFNALEKYKLLDNRLIILSASFHNLNDGQGRESRIFPEPALVVNMNTIEKIRYLRLNYFCGIKNIYIYKILETALLLKGNNTTVTDGGFVGCDGILTDSLIIPYRDHTWYHNPDLRNTRYKLVRETIQKLAGTNSSIVIFNPPVPPAWYKVYGKTPLDSLEREYASIMSTLCSPYSNIHFLDYYANPCPSLNDSMFYDIMHTNTRGAEVFTRDLYARLKSMNIICRRDQSVFLNTGRAADCH